MAMLPYYLLRDLRNGELSFASPELIASGDYEEVLLNEYWLIELGFHKVDMGIAYYYARVIMDCYQVVTNLNTEAKHKGWYVQGINEGDSLRLYTVSDLQGYLLRLFDLEYIIAKDQFVRRNLYPTIIFSRDGIVEDLNTLMFIHVKKVLKLPVTEVKDFRIHINEFGDNPSLIKQIDAIRKVIKTGVTYEDVRILEDGVGYKSRTTLFTEKLTISVNRGYFGSAPITV